MHNTQAMPERIETLRALALPTAIVVAFLFFNPAIIADWRVYSFDDGTYSHAYLMPLIIAFLFWKAAEEQQLVQRWKASVFALFLLLLLVFVWFQVAQQTYLSRLLLPMVLILAFGAVFRLNLAVLVPLSMFWFITPIWGVVNSQLQAISVWAVKHLMRLTDIPTYIEGNLVQIPAGTFEIADGCSGLRYLIAVLPLTILFCYLNLRRMSSMAILLTLAILGSMVTNWIRIAIIIYVGDYTDMQSSLIEDHNTFGWYLFMPFIALLYYIGYQLESGPLPPLAPVTQDTVNRSSIGATLVTASLVTISGIMVQVLQPGPVHWVKPIVDVETATAYTENIDGVKPKIFAASSLVRSSHEIRGTTVEHQYYLFHGETDAHRPDFYRNDIIPAGWQEITNERFDEHARAMLRGPDGKHAMLIYWYEIGGHRVADATALVKHRLLEALKLNQTTALSWNLISCPASCETSSERDTVIEELLSR